MQNKVTQYVHSFFTHASKRAQFPREITDKFSSAASAPLDSGNRLLSYAPSKEKAALKNARKAKDEFRTALKTVERELSACKGEDASDKNALLQIKGDALLGLGKVQLILMEGEDSGEAKEKACALFTGAIDIFKAAGNPGKQASALVFRSQAQGGKLKTAMDDLYAAFQLILALPGKELMPKIAESFVSIAKDWNELPYYAKALEILSALPQNLKGVNEAIEEVGSKMREVQPVQNKAQVTDKQLTGAPDIVLDIGLLFGDGEIDLNDPRLAEHGLRLSIDGQEIPLTVHPVSHEYRDIPASNVPGWLKDDAFRARIGDVMPLERGASMDISKLPEGKETFARLLTQGMDLKQGARLCAEGDLLVANDKAAAREKYLEAIAVLGQIPIDSWKAKEAHNLISILTEKIGQCGGTV